MYMKTMKDKQRGSGLSENMERERELLVELVQTNMERFAEYSGIFVPQWWLLLAFLIVPWIIWSKVVDEKKKLEIVTVGLFAALVTTLLDIVGYNLQFWDYPIQLIPLVPEAFAFDLSMVPVAYMLLYQYLKTWKSYVIGVLCMSAVYAFIGEPFCNRIMVVSYINWNYAYSAVFYIVTGFAIKAIVSRLAEKCSKGRMV